MQKRIREGKKKKKKRRRRKKSRNHMAEIGCEKSIIGLLLD
jgi:hypothetical protein